VRRRRSSDIDLASSAERKKELRGDAKEIEK